LRQELEEMVVPMWEDLLEAIGGGDSEE